MVIDSIEDVQDAVRTKHIVIVKNVGEECGTIISINTGVEFTERFWTAITSRSLAKTLMF